MKGRDSDEQPKPREDGGMKGKEEKDKKTGLVIKSKQLPHSMISCFLHPSPSTLWILKGKGEESLVVC
jgi:hypothetical protein